MGNRRDMQANLNYFLSKCNNINNTKSKNRVKPFHYNFSKRIFIKGSMIALFELLSEESSNCLKIGTAKKRQKGSDKKFL